MSLALQFSIESDTATPALRKFASNLAPRPLAAVIGPAVTGLVKENYQRLPPNKIGPSTHFWAAAGDSTNWEALDDGVMITTEKTGVRLRYLGTAGLPGGRLRPVRAEWLTIPACAEAYGKSARSFSNLRFARAGRGQGAPALVKTDAAGKPIKEEVMFWLARSVCQDPNPRVLPTDDDFCSVISQALETVPHP